jgi:hypothetical protein
LRYGWVDNKEVNETVEKAASAEELSQLKLEIERMKKKLPAPKSSHEVSGGNQAMAMLPAEESYRSSSSTYDKVKALEKLLAEHQSIISDLAVGHADMRDITDNLDQRLDKQEANGKKIQTKKTA